jgi:hypothetical protein
MNQRINFYSDAYRPKVDYLSLNLCAIYLGSFVGVLLLATLVQVVGQQSVRGKLAAAESAKVEWLAQIKQLEGVIEDRAKDPALEAVAAQLERDQKDKLTLRQFLQQEVPGNVVGFSGYLEDLARYHINGLRLTDISLAAGGEKITIRGEVLSGEYVTNYIDGLDQSDQFRGHEFRQLQLNRGTSESVANQLPDGQSLVFEISTGSASE